MIRILIVCATVGILTAPVGRAQQPASAKDANEQSRSLETDVKRIEPRLTEPQANADALNCNFGQLHEKADRFMELETPRANERTLSQSSKSQVSNFV